MKPLNFIESHRYTSTPSLNHWKKFSCFLALITLSILACIQTKQLYAFYKIKQEHGILATYIARQKELLTDKKDFTNKAGSQQHKSLSTVKKNMPHKLIAAVAEAIPDGALVLHMMAHRKKRILSLKGQALDSEQVTQFLRALGTCSLVKKVTLIHLLKDTQHMYSSYEIEISY